MGDTAIRATAVPETWTIVGDYYAFKTQYAGKPQPKRTPKRALEYAERYLAWAREQDIDPHLFMRSAFETFARGKPGSFPALVGMRSKKLLVAWREYREGAVLEQERFRRMKRVKRTQLERTVRKLRAKPTKMQDATRSDYGSKRRYALCMIDEVSGGYDPRSKVCQKCPVKYECLLGTNNKYGFDVGALRVGLFSRLPAEVAEAAQR